MNDPLVSVERTEDFAAVRRLGVACGLEDSGRGDEAVEAAFAAFAGETLVGAVVLERYRGLETLNWMAVDGAYRHRGIAGRLVAALEREALRRGVSRLWVTARAPGFFLAHGYADVAPGRERDILLQECSGCEQFGRGCEPRALSKRIDGDGLPGGPPNEGDQ